MLLSRKRLHRIKKTKSQTMKNKKKVVEEKKIKKIKVLVKRKNHLI